MSERKKERKSLKVIINKGSYSFFSFIFSYLVRDPIRP
jgi:hypothetical protein